MVPLVDTHCHLLAGLDDGPRSDEEALDVCRLLCEQGVRAAAATAHLGEDWPLSTPAAIRAGAERLAGQLHSARLPLAAYPCGEIMIRPEIEGLWDAGQLLGVSDRAAYALLEMPHGVCIEAEGLVRRFVERGVRPILAHPERCPELLHDRQAVANLIAAGCLIQVVADSLLAPQGAEDERALRDWFAAGLVHLVASDAHSPRRRAPRMADAWRRVADWAGSDAANRLCGTNGLIVLEGAPLRAPPPQRPTRRTFFQRG